MRSSNAWRRLIGRRLPKTPLSIEGMLAGTTGDVGASPAPGSTELPLGVRRAQSIAADRRGKPDQGVGFTSAFYRAVIDSSTDYAIIATDMTGSITVRNIGAERIIGWSEQEMLGSSVDRFFTPEDRAARRPDVEMEVALKDGRASDERWHLRRDGSRFWAIGLIMPLRVDDKQVGFIKILRDRTVDRKAEEQQARTEERLRIALEAASMIGIWDLDLSSSQIFGDANFARLVGVSQMLAETGALLSSCARRVHLEHLPALRAAAATAIRQGSSLSQESRIGSPGGPFRWVTITGKLICNAAGKPARLSGVVVDITDRKNAEMRQAAIIELNDRLRDGDQPEDIMFAAAEVLGKTLGLSRCGYGSIDVSQETLEVTRDWSRAGSPTLQGTYPLWRFGSFVDELKNGNTIFVDDVTQDDRTVRSISNLRTLGIRAMLNVPVLEHGRLVAVLYLQDSKVRHWEPEKISFIREVAQRTRDAVERRRAEDQQKLLARELQHRVKNTLAVVQGIASQTFKEAGSAAEREAFEKRLVALSEANSRLTQGGWAPVSLQLLVTSATSPHCAAPERFTVSGPMLQVSADAALGLTLALHELCTNTVKYGALSSAYGHVDVSWSIDAEYLKFQWREHGGSTASKPARQGFGTRLVERTVKGQLRGRVHLDYAEAGLTCSFDIPLRIISAGI